MNLILFEEHELGKALPRRDERTVHLLKVLRKKTGDSFDAGLLGGMRGRGRIEKINIDGSIIVSLKLDEAAPERLPLRVAVGFPRPIQLKRLFRDLSSLGIGAVDLLETELGEKSYRDTNLLKDGGARAAFIEGAVQSRDTSIPELAVYGSLGEWLEARPWDRQGNTGKLLSVRTVPLLVAADNVRPEGAMARLSPVQRPVVLAVGSERGWSDTERDRLETAGFLRLSLGPRALRTETACVAAAIIAMEKIGALEDR
ncbi:MAG: 16S rRNA (uracil(1498)-N(3))-methyltransferase [Treponema sp.]|jgi:RsmE family RNA methyltransferase|nr:16S rRNA (uracil(1498)-N(3))-methyltransferase [Treponema sp.]